MIRPGRAAAGMLALAPLVAVLLLGVRGPAYADERVFRWQDPAITESSGLVVAEGRFVTVNDSGNSAELYVVDPASGATVERVPWAASQIDVEGLAPGPDGSVWVGDVGDNLGARERVTVSRVPLDGGPVATYALRYPDGRARDAETLLAHPRTGRLHLVTKGLVGEVYAAPARLRSDRPNRLRLVGTAGPALTDGAFWPDGEHVLLRGYGLAFLYSFPGLELLGSVELPSQPQGEALAVTSSGEVFVSSEGAGTPGATATSSSCESGSGPGCMSSTARTRRRRPSPWGCGPGRRGWRSRRTGRPRWSRTSIRRSSMRSRVASPRGGPNSGGGCGFAMSGSGRPSRGWRRRGGSAGRRTGGPFRVPRPEDRRERNEGLGGRSGLVGGVWAGGGYAAFPGLSRRGWSRLDWGGR